LQADCLRRQLGSVPRHPARSCGVRLTQFTFRTAGVE
jgi:hypothetical protein